MKCEICGNEFVKANGLVRHIRQYHHMSDKDYYDSYCRQDGEGLCLTCGKSTSFLYFSIGYEKYCSVDCNPNADVKVCAICKKRLFNLKTLSQHLKEHNITPKDYYDIYLKKDGEGACVVCGRPTKFKQMRYFPHCSISCASSDKAVQAKLKTTMNKRHGVEYPSQSKNIQIKANNSRKKHIVEGKYSISLLQQNPELCKEWDYDKNTVQPNEMSYKSGKKVWWKCWLGHSYCASIANRNNGNGCPYCSNRKVLKGYNDLATVNPELCKEWDYNKNKYSPDAISGYSTNIKFFWRCSLGHSYQSTVANRNNGYNCPYCSNHMILEGFNDLITTNPELAEEWDYDKNSITPNRIGKNHYKKVWWKCSLGHSWKASPRDRNKGKDNFKTNCPICDNRMLLVGFNDLQTKCPQLTKEWDYEVNYPLTPKDIIFHSGKYVGWKCKYGHTWNTRVIDRTSGNMTGCPLCGNQTSMPEQTIAYYLKQVCEVQQRHKINGNEVDVYLPQYKIGIEYDGWYYHKNKLDKDLNKARKLIDDGICVVNIVETKGNTNSVVKIYDNNIRISYKYDNADANFENALLSLFDWLATYTTNKNFTNIDVNIKRDKIQIKEQFGSSTKKNSIAALYPELAKEWDYDKNGRLTPNDFVGGSNVSVYWKCSKGHSWVALINSRVRGNGCPYCANKRVLEGFNDLLTLNSQLSLEWNYDKNAGLCNKRGEDISTPNKVMAVSKYKVWWRCSTCGNEWQASIDCRNNGNRCRKCASRLRNARMSKQVMNIETKTIYSSLAEASDKTGLSKASICYCCKGKYKSAGGYHWKYVDT